jgi:hypothetical protein
MQKQIVNVTKVAGPAVNFSCFIIAIFKSLGSGEKLGRVQKQIVNETKVVGPAVNFSCFIIAIK